jgi:hypothetical protein
MSNAYIIETSRYAAGIVTGEASGFRFFAAHPEMASLDGALFASPKAAELAAARLVEAKNRRAGKKSSPARNF